MAVSAERRIDLGPHKPGSIWPTPGQLQLLRAALWPGAEGRAAWAAWQNTTDLRTIDFSSWNLLPLVWRNLSGQGLADPVLEECRGYYRFHWVKNQILLKQAGGWVAAWQEQGIPVVVLKGAALLTDCYQDAGLRPMGDVDLLVPLEKVQAAAAWLQREGWSKHFHRLAWANVSLEAQQSYNWQKGDARLDLHWHVDEHCTDPGVTREYWAQVQPLHLDGVATSRLCPEHMLLHVCSHGMIWNPSQAPFRWMVDAHYILRRYGREFNWARLMDMAGRTGATLALRHGLDFVATELRLPVPADVLSGLRNRRYGWRERYAYHCTTHPSQGGRLGRSLKVARLLGRMAGQGPLLVRWQRVSRAMCTRWGARTLPEALWLVLRKLVTGDRKNWLDRDGGEARP